MTTSSISALRERLVLHGQSLFARGFSVGTGGNISVKVPGGYLVTPTNSWLGRLSPERIALLDDEWRHVSGDKPSKELPLHRSMYDSRPGTGAVVHLHSTYATALSLLPAENTQDILPNLTPYAVMRVGRVALVPYTRPGSDAVVEHIMALQGRHKAILLGNHGPVVADASLDDAVAAAEELEETAKLAIITRPHSPRLLSAADVADLEQTFGKSSR